MKKKVINSKKYHTCGRCKHEHTPDNKYPCVSCIYGTGYGADLWELEQESEYEHDNAVVKAYNDGQAFILDMLRKEIELLPTKTRTNWDGCCPNIKYPEIEYVDVSKKELLNIIDKYREGFILPLPKSKEK